jgi:xanthine dehydrogenase YagR molybdenum-binding subunit
MDALAKALEMDPLALRLHNYAETSPQRDTPYTAKGLREAYRIGAERIDWQNRHEKERDAGLGGPWRRGWGMASQIWGGGGGPPANALVKLLPDGTAEVIAGVQEIGTGTKTVLAQLAAEELGLAVDQVRVVVGDTRPAPYGPTSAGSMTVASVGPAVRSAARQALEEFLEIAAHMLELPDKEARHLKAKDGEIYDERDPQKCVPFPDVGALMGGYTIVGDGARGPNPEDKAVNTFGAHFVEVAVNVETGQVRVERIVAVHEIGRVINPLTAANQVYGGVIQSLGFGTMEERVLDPQTGLQLTANLEDYRIPTMADVPEIEVIFVDEADPAANSVGAKGLGEPPIIPTAAAIANAIADASGVRLAELPMTPDRVLRALRARQEEKK